MGSPSYRQLSLGISLAAHFAAGAALIANAGIGTASLESRGSNVMAVRLVRAEGQLEPAQRLGIPAKESHQTKQAEPMMPVAAAMPQQDENEALISLPAHAEPHYYPTRELSLRPIVTTDVSPAMQFVGVPAQSVILRLFINEEGSIDRVDTEQSFLPEDMAKDLRDAFSRVKFQPGMRDGNPVKSQMRIEVRLDDDHERTATQ